MTVTTGAADLLALDADAFREVVDNDLRGNLDADTSAALRAPAVIDRYYRTLIAMRQNAEAQLGAKRAELANTRHGIFSDTRLTDHGRYNAWMEAQARYGKWRAGTLRFRAGLERQISEVRRLRDEAEGDRNELLQRTRQLESAIRRHRDRFPADDEPTPDDLALWETLT